MTRLPDRPGAGLPSVALVIGRLVGRSGGAERIFVELANMLVARGHAVTCLHLDEAEGEPFYPLDRRVALVNVRPKRPLPRRPLLKWLTSSRVPERVRHMAAWYLKKDPVVAALRHHLRQAAPDVAISFLPPANTVTLLAAVDTNIAVIPTNHNVPERDYADPGRWSGNPHDRVLRLKALRHAAAIHVLFAEFGAWFPPHLQDRIAVIPNYVSNDILRHSPRPTRDNVILAVGRLMPAKNHGVLLEAWAGIAARHPGWRVVVYGEGPEREALAARIASLGLADSFVLGGHCADPGEAYARAAIFCHPALFEGFGLAPAEALALETPVVAFADCPGVNQFVVDGLNGLLVDRVGGAGALAAGLEKLITDPALRRRLGQAGPSSVAGYTEEAFANAWVALIERCSRSGSR